MIGGLNTWIFVACICICYLCINRMPRADLEEHWIKHSFLSVLSVIINIRKILNLRNSKWNFTMEPRVFVLFIKMKKYTIVDILKLFHCNFWGVFCQDWVQYTTMYFIFVDNIVPICVWSKSFILSLCIMSRGLWI